MITSSRLALAAACPGAFTLPWLDEPNEHSDAGTERHAADEESISSGDVPEIYEERWPGLSWRAEVRYVYSIADDTAREVGVGSSRDYGELGPFDVGGTIDAEGRGPGLLVVVDRKGFERQEPAEHHRQVRFLALAAARARAAQRIVVAIRPEVGPMDVADLDPVFDLDLIAHQVRQLVMDTARVRAEARAGRGAPFATGRWCRWCPAFTACPKQQELRALVRLDDEDPELAISTFVDDDSAADVYALWKRIGILHKRIGQQLYRHAAVRPIQLGGGRVFGRHDKLGNERLSGDTTYEVVRDLFGQEVADRAVERAATKTRLEDALRGRRGALKAVLEAVRARGGATRSTGSSIEEYDLQLPEVS